MGLDKFRQTWAGKGEQVFMGQTHQAKIGDIFNGCVMITSN